MMTIIFTMMTISIGTKRTTTAITLPFLFLGSPHFSFYLSLVNSPNHLICLTCYPAFSLTPFFIGIATRSIIFSRCVTSQGRKLSALTWLVFSGHTLQADITRHRFLIRYIFLTLVLLLFSAMRLE